ncbi:MerR family transcriptional regulator [Pelagibius sp. 7325]|uniref:MerR family transcriptional regulator n=1 Tax=Pelagibius sp. 7325 TaxID=3131994 RepID=UPI0030EED700
MPESRPAGKSAAAFRTISEVSDELDVPQHVLRFWEGKFSQVRPLKRGGGRRYYRPEDIDLLRRIRDLLYSDGYTIKGVQRLLREGKGKDAGEGEVDGTRQAAPVKADPVKAAAVDTAPLDAAREIKAVIDELSELRDMLKAARKGAS